jgi:hypothetical protein
MKTLVTGLALGLAALTGLDESARAEEKPAAAAAPTTPEKPAENDGFRLRGGFSFNGGTGFGNGLSGGVVSFGARLGLQFNHYFSVYYQNTPMVTLLAANNGVAAGFADYNSAVANLTLLHAIDIGAGPSVDYVSVAGCTADIECGTSSTVAFGLHSRVALNIGGLSGNGPRRSGFSIGVDVHPIFLPGGPLVTMTGGLGGEWY